MRDGISIADWINRRIGGLENHLNRQTIPAVINRRIGGLEIHPFRLIRQYRINRRIGGLEIKKGDSSKK